MMIINYLWTFRSIIKVELETLFDIKTSITKISCFLNISVLIDSYCY